MLKVLTIKHLKKTKMTRKIPQPKKPPRQRKNTRPLEYDEHNDFTIFPTPCKIGSIIFSSDEENSLYFQISGVDDEPLKICKFGDGVKNYESSGIKFKFITIDSQGLINISGNWM